MFCFFLLHLICSSSSKTGPVHRLPWYTFSRTQSNEAQMCVLAFLRASVLVCAGHSTDGDDYLMVQNAWWFYCPVVSGCICTQIQVFIMSIINLINAHRAHVWMPSCTDANFCRSLCIMMETDLPATDENNSAFYKTRQEQKQTKVWRENRLEESFLELLSSWMKPKEESRGQEVEKFMANVVLIWRNTTTNTTGVTTAVTQSLPETWATFTRVHSRFTKAEIWFGNSLLMDKQLTDV